MSKRKLLEMVILEQEKFTEIELDNAQKIISELTLNPHLSFKLSISSQETTYKIEP